MQGDGAIKGFVGVFFAILLILGICFWQQTLAISRIIVDLIVLNLKPLIESFLKK